MPLVTVIIPTFSHAQTLPYSVASVLQQTFTDFELLIIGDGATAETAKAAQKLAKADKRITFHSFPKSARTGEEYRHQLLQKATSKYICYLSDDDLWLPTHLEQMLSLLQKHHFAYTFPAMITPQGNFDTWYGDLDLPFYKRWLLKPDNLRYNFIPLSTVGHTLTSYKKLPFGWRSTPKGKHTDLHMWQQFLSQPKIKTTRGNQPTTLHFASSLRKTATDQERAAETSHWFKQLPDPELPHRITTGLLTSVYTNNLEIQQNIRTTKTFQLHQKVKFLMKLGGLSK